MRVIECAWLGFVVLLVAVICAELGEEVTACAVLSSAILLLGILCTFALRNLLSAFFRVSGLPVKSDDKFWLKGAVIFSRLFTVVA